MPAPRRHNWLFIFGVWTAVGVLLSIQTYIGLSQMPDSPRGHLVLWVAQMYRAWLWALLTPAVFMLRQQLQERHRNLVVRFSLHVLAAVTLLAWCNIVRLWALNVTFGWWRLEDYGIDAIWGMLSARSFIDFYIYWIVVAADYVRELVNHKVQTELREEQLHTQLVRAELAALKQQVQPHFLFNSLNAIASIMREGDSKKAVEAISLLSQLLRQLMANGGRQEIELWRELDYAQCYLSVEKVRFEEKLITDFDADEDCLNALVPTLILQPLVENAVKHGIAQRRNPGRVRVTARRVPGDRLRLEVFNDPAEGGRKADARDNHGIGLQATRARLERAFGPTHRLEYDLHNPEGCLVRIELPLQAAGLPSHA
ncbi:sensor histidine kinase [Oleiharenicola sp. Vm1]|uniref:sensor histidine kinase n=1 Tax=Oleiharenicola sp. Vm1 TaxID=3398393 RepID=UPI0039F5DDD2